MGDRIHHLDDFFCLNTLKAVFAANAAHRSYILIAVTEIL